MLHSLVRWRWWRYERGGGGGGGSRIGFYFKAHIVRAFRLSVARLRFRGVVGRKQSREERRGEERRGEERSGQVSSWMTRVRVRAHSQQSDLHSCKDNNWKGGRGTRDLRIIARREKSPSSRALGSCRSPAWRKSFTQAPQQRTDNTRAHQSHSTTPAEQDTPIVH